MGRTKMVRNPNLIEEIVVVMAEKVDDVTRCRLTTGTPVRYLYQKVWIHRKIKQDFGNLVDILTHDSMKEAIVRVHPTNLQVLPSRGAGVSTKLKSGIITNDDDD